MPHPFDRQRFLHWDNLVYRNEVKRILDLLFDCDCGEGDITTQMLLSKNGCIIVNANIIAKEVGIFAGGEEIKNWLSSNKLTKELKVVLKKCDGNRLKKGQEIFRITGSIEKILLVERTILNVLQRLSGIATLTNLFVQVAKPIFVTATRKTFWGMLDKKAVALGGGLTHRLNLSDAILIKENHLAGLERAGSNNTIGDAIGNAWKKVSKDSFLEIEVENRAEAVEAAKQLQLLKTWHGKKFPPAIIMLDNFTPKEISFTIDLIQRLNLAQGIFFEASGGINLKNIRHYKKTGVHTLSIGAITHSAKGLDMSLEFDI